MPEFPHDYHSKENQYTESREQGPKPLTLRSMMRNVLNVVSARLFTTSSDKQKLAGRIHQLHTDARDVRRQLEAIREDLEAHIDGELTEHIAAVLDPILADVDRIQHTMGSKAVMQRYSQWMDRAQLWVELCTKAKGRDEIIRAVIRHVAEDSQRRIDRDARVIEDYMHHAILTLPLTYDQKMAVQRRVSDAIAPILEELSLLKSIPKEITLEEIAEWQAAVDQKRQALFDFILQTIDNTIRA